MKPTQLHSRPFSLLAHNHLIRTTGVTWACPWGVTHCVYLQCIISEDFLKPHSAEQAVQSADLPTSI